VVDAIRVELKRPGLQVRFHEVTEQNRISLIKNGTIDLECSTTTHNAEREKEVSFSITYFIANLRMVTRKDYKIRNFDDLEGKVVVVSNGSTTEQVLRKKLNLDALRIRLLRGNYEESFLMVRSGRAVAYIMDDALLAGLIASLRDPRAYEIVGDSLGEEHYAIMMRKDDAPLKEIVDKALTDLMRSGEAQKIYERWFMSPIPPHGVNMNLPMSKALKEAFAHPSDKGSE
jgi:glutamate/aspartate transport system substrate-binding protein